MRTMSRFLRKANKYLQTCYYKLCSPLPQPPPHYTNQVATTMAETCFIAKCNLHFTKTLNIVGNLTNCTKIHFNTKIFILSNVQRGFRISLFIIIYLFPTCQT